MPHSMSWSSVEMEQSEYNRGNKSWGKKIKGGLLERIIFKYEVPLSVTLAEFLTSHHRTAHSPDAVLDVQCSRNVPLGRLHCPVINLNNRLHYIGSTVNFYNISSQCKEHLKNLLSACYIFIWDSYICLKCTNFSQPQFVRTIKGAMRQKLFSITTAFGSKIQYTS